MRFASESVHTILPEDSAIFFSPFPRFFFKCFLSQGHLLVTSSKLNVETFREMVI